jgi:hypothetical protein
LLIQCLQYPSKDNKEFLCTDYKISNNLQSYEGKLFIDNFGMTFPTITPDCIFFGEFFLKRKKHLKNDFGGFQSLEMRQK